MNIKNIYFLGKFRSLLQQNIKHPCRYTSKWSVLFFGSDEVSLASLQKLNDECKNGSTLRCLDIVSSNVNNIPNVVEKFAALEKLSFTKWPPKRSLEKYDVGLVVSFGHLIPEWIIKSFPLGMINIHTSLLPRWRGASPVIHTLLHGDTVAGVTLMRIRPKKFDIGEIISSKSIDVSPDIRLPELTAQLAKLGAEELLQCIQSLPEWLERAQPQSDVAVTYAPKITKEISDVRWEDMTAREIYNLHRAIYGIHDLTTHFKNHQVKLFDPFLIESDETEQEQPVGIIGTIQFCKRLSAIKVLCKNASYIYFKHVRIVGKRKISAFDFCNGYVKKVSKSDNRFYYAIGNSSLKIKSKL